jgi:single-strand DNA-binding protein
VRNKAAEICEKYLSKGDRIYVEGRIKTRKWQDDSGNERYSTEIQCTDFTFLTTKKESEGQTPTKQQASQKTDNQQVANEPIGEEDDDLPF